MQFGLAAIETNLQWSASLNSERRASSAENFEQCNILFRGFRVIRDNCRAEQTEPFMCNASVSISFLSTQALSCQRLTMCLLSLSLRRGGEDKLCLKINRYEGFKHFIVAC